MINNMMSKCRLSSNNKAAVVDPQDIPWQTTVAAKLAWEGKYHMLRSAPPSLSAIQSPHWRAYPNGCIQAADGVYTSLSQCQRERELKIHRQFGR